MTVIVLLGNSGVGKDTLANALIEHYQGNAVNFKVVAELKRQWEKRLGLPYGAIELRSVKRMLVPGMGQFTYGDWMVREFQKSQLDKGYRHPLIQRMMSEIEWYCDNNIPVICTDIRMPDEVEALIDFNAHCPSPVLKVCVLSRSGIVGLESDRHLWDNLKRFIDAGVPFNMLTEDGSVVQWVKEIVGASHHWLQ